MVSVVSNGKGHLRAECSVCGWTCVGAPSDHFTRAVNVHIGRHRSPFGPVLAGLVRVAEPAAEACRYAHDTGRYGPCGGPSNGRECWQHVGAASGVTPVGGAR